jgi:hypothetical protein
MENIILLLHPAIGVLAMLAAVWVFVDALNANEGNLKRILNVSILCAVLMWLTYIVAGYFYVVYYNADKAIIKSGSWAFGHNFFMETKEHVFFMLLLLATYLPIVARDLLNRRTARTVLLWVAGLIVPTTLAMEGSGAIIGMAVRIGLLKGAGG